MVEMYNTCESHTSAKNDKKDKRMGTRRKHQRLDQVECAEKVTEEQFALLKKLSKDRAADIRCRVAEQLCIPGSAEAEAILIRLLSDRDDMVRVNASDSLSACGSQASSELLKQRTVSDSCFMVRGYAACSAVEIALRTGSADDELADFLTQAMDVESDEWVRTSFCAALYELGQEEYLHRLLGALNSDDYQVRCAAANLLSGTAKEKDAPKIRAALKTRREKEDPEILSVISTIDRCLEEMDNASR